MSYINNGFALNTRELTWFVKLGIANEQALQAATVAPAEMSGWKEPRARATAANLTSRNSARLWIFANGMVPPCSCPIRHMMLGTASIKRRNAIAKISIDIGKN